jgi:hypothetical protein
MPNSKCQGKKKYCLYAGLSCAAVTLLTVIGSYVIAKEEVQVDNVATINMNHQVHEDITKAG